MDKIIKRWVKQAMDDYLGGKTVALFDADTCKMLSFGVIDPSQVDLYCTNRNQPWAKILVNRSK
jgi:hypothetical protein